MSTIALPRPLRGIITPMVTPLSGQDQLDIAGLERLIEHMLDGGVHALFALGTTGEGPSLSYGVRHQMVERVCDRVAGRVPVLVGITDTAFAASIELAQTAYQAGAAAVVAAAPYYLPISQSELVDYYQSLARAIDLPVFLYNMPSCTKVSLEPETVLRLSEVENIVGFKDSSGDLDYLRAVADRVRDRPEFTMTVGPEELLAEAIALGAHGGVNGGSNMFPRLYVRLYEAAVGGDQEQVDRYHQLVLQVFHSVYDVGEGVSRFVKATKCVLKCLGICDDYVARPFRKFQGAQRDTLERNTRQLVTALGGAGRTAVSEGRSRVGRRSSAASPQDA